MFRKFPIIILVLIIVACQPSALKSDIATPTSVTAITLTTTSTMIPTTPPTATPTVIYPVAMNTPWPQPVKIINSDNVEQLVPLASWGYGLISDVAVAPDQSKFVVATFTGFHLYDVKTMRLLGSVTTRSPVLTITFSPDGDTLATGHSDNSVQLWDVTNQEWIQSLVFPFDDSQTAPFDGIMEILYSPDGNLLEVTGRLASEEYVKFWKISTRKNIMSFEKNNSCNIKISPNKLDYVFADADSVKFIRLEDGAVINEIKIRYVNQIRYSPDGRILAVINGNAISLVDTSDGSIFKKISGKYIEFSATNNTIATTTDDGHVQIWSIAQDGNEVTPGRSINGFGIGQAQNFGEINCAAYTDLRNQYKDNSHLQYGVFSPDGNYFSLLKNEPPTTHWSLENEELLIYQVSDGSVEETISIPHDGYDAPLFDLGKVLFLKEKIITLSNNLLYGSIFRAWDMKTNKMLMEINPILPALPVAFSPDNKSLVSFSPNGGKKLFIEVTPNAENYFNNVKYNEYEFALRDVSRGNILKEYAGFQIFNPFTLSDASFSVDGSEFLYSGHGDVYTWRIVSRQPQYASGAIAYSSDNSKAIANGNKITIPKSSVVFDTQNKHSDLITSLVYSKDGNLLASADSVGQIIVWNVKSGEPIQEIKTDKRVNMIKISSNNQYIATLSAQENDWKSATLNLWKITDGSFIKTLDQGYSISFDFSLDGQFLVSSRESQWMDVINFYSTIDGHLLRTINTPYHNYAAVSFSPDGTMLAMAFQGVLQIWGVDLTK